MKSRVLIFVLLLLAGCGGVNMSPDEIKSKVKNGMSESEVVLAVGKPVSGTTEKTPSGDSIRTLTYSADGGKSVVVTLNADKVTSVEAK